MEKQLSVLIKEGPITGLVIACSKGARSVQGVSPYEIPDIMQTALCAYCALDETVRNGITNKEGYCYITARHFALNTRKQSGRLLPLKAKVMDMVDDNSPEHDDRDEQIKRMLWLTKDIYTSDLNPRHRQIFDMHLANRSNGEIAQATDLQLNSVKSILCKIKADYRHFALPFISPLYHNQ